MSTVNMPVTFGETKGDLGFDYVFAAEGIRDRLADTLDLMSLGIVPLIGDPTGTGTDTLRITDIGGVGWNVAMDALDTETSQVPEKEILTGFSTVAVADFGLGHSETYKSQILGRESAIKLDALIARLPTSWMATFRREVCKVIASFSTTIGSKGRELEIDDLLDLTSIYTETLGAMRTGRFSLAVHPKQRTQVLKSARTEPAFQQAAATLQAQQAPQEEQIDRNFLGLGFDLWRTDDIEVSGGGYDGGAFAPGGVGWARARSSAVTPANPERAIVVDEFGLLVEEDPSSGRTAERRYGARAWIGFASASTDVHLLRAVVSTD